MTVLSTLALAFAAFATLPAAAAAAGYVPDGGRMVQVTGNPVPSGVVVVDFAGTYFESGESVSFTVTGAGLATLGALRAGTAGLVKSASPSGSATLRVTLPADAAGPYTVTGTGLGSGIVGGAVLTVVPADSGVPPAPATPVPATPVPATPVPAVPAPPAVFPQPPATGDPASNAATDPASDGPAAAGSPSSATASSSAFRVVESALAASGTSTISPPAPGDSPPVPIAETAEAGAPAAPGGNGSAPLAPNQRNAPAAPTVLTAGLVPILEALSNPVAIGGSILAGLMFVVLGALPTQLLAATIKEHSQRRRATRSRLPAPLAAVGAWFAVRPVVSAAALITAASLVQGLADPDFGFDLASLRLVLACMIAAFVVGFGSVVLAAAVARRRWQTPVVIALRPWALLLTVVGIVLSRMIDFTPASSSDS